jgi:cytochrome o ubiquinol oxidase subunit 2
MDDFEKLATPSENHPVEYFSTTNPELFKQVIDKFKMSHGKMDMPEHKGMDMSHAASAGAEE